MKLRPVQLVCLALLLATLRLADPAALPPGDFALRVGVLQVLLGTDAADKWTKPASRVVEVSRVPAPAVRVRRVVAPLPATALAALRTCWTMLPPADHSVAVQSFTGFARG